MNKLHITSIISSFSALAAMIAMVYAVDTRYVHASDFNQFQQAYLEGQVRDLRQELREAERAGDEAWEDDVMVEMEELLDQLCLDFPDSRYCRGD
jgi:hypothetical protein